MRGTPWAEVKAKAIQRNKNSVKHYQEVLKYVKHSKKKAIAQRNLNDAQEWLDEMERLDNMTFEELGWE